MPQIHTMTSFKYDELSDKAKEKARDWFREHALDYDWWDSTYEDASNIGLKITSFDLGRYDIDGKLEKPADEVAALILANHGDKCRTYIEALAFSLEFVATEDDEETDLVRQFRRKLLSAYLRILQDEYDYRMGDESIAEDIEANEYDFFEDGRRFHL